MDLPKAKLRTITFGHMLLGDINIRLSNFVPLMRTTHVGTTTQDNISFETSPYCLIANVGRGQQNKMKIVAPN